MIAAPWIVYAGIDPGATTGLVAVALPPSVYQLNAARLVGFATVTAGSSSTESRANVKARLFDRIRAQLKAWTVSVAVIEEPWDALPTWNTRTGGQGSGGGKSLLDLARGGGGDAKKGAGKGGAARGTVFQVGVSFGLALAAASDLPWDVAIASYPVTSAPAKGRKPERIGWMQRRQSRCPEHTKTAIEQALQLRGLKERPLGGMLPSAADLAREENDNVYMALGVLSFHLDRQRGIV